MLWFNNIVIEGFGPYKERTVIDFPEEEGVTIVFGANMRGKTSLLNAIRYALYGKVLGRDLKELPLSDISNLENKEEGKYGFNITLNFQYVENTYQIVRQCDLRSGVSVPESELDYVQNYYLRKNGDVLPPEERDTELNKILPESISRFFLFDGELLQEYEELLIDESEMGNRIRDAIERILGMPVLINSRADSRELFQEAGKLETKAAQKDKTTREIGNFLEETTKQKEYQQEELKKFLEEIKGVKNKKIVLENELDKTQNIERLLNERNNLRDIEIPALESKKITLESNLKDLMANSWRHVIGEKISNIRTEISEKIEDITQQKIKTQIAKKQFEEIKNSLSIGECPTCKSLLGDKGRKNLIELEKKYNVEYSFDEKELQRLIQQNAILANFESLNKKEEIKSISEQIDDVSIKIVIHKDRISEIEDSLGESNGSDIKTKRNEYEKAIKDIALLEEGIKKQKDTIESLEETEKKLTSQLDKIGGVDIIKERERRELYSSLLELFDEGIGLYREALRTKVEKDATDLFVNMTTEPDYKGLKINENYGLTIISKDGTPSPIRSAGAEHIVAFSLIGALQKNTPLRGPVIMDSPFIRLDENHKKNVLSALELMAPQVMLLVFEDELNPETARSELLGNLRKEYKLERVSGRHTKIVKQ